MLILFFLNFFRRAQFWPGIFLYIRSAHQPIPAVCAGRLPCGLAEADAEVAEAVEANRFRNGGDAAVAVLLQQLPGPFHAALGQ